MACRPPPTISGRGTLHTPHTHTQAYMQKHHKVANGTQGISLMCACAALAQMSWHRRAGTDGLAHMSWHTCLTAACLGPALKQTQAELKRGDGRPRSPLCVPPGERSPIPLVGAPTTKPPPPPTPPPHGVSLAQPSCSPSPASLTHSLTHSLTGRSLTCLIHLLTPGRSHTCLIHSLTGRSLTCLIHSLTGRSLTCLPHSHTHG